MYGAFCDVGHCLVRLCHVKVFRTQPQHGVIHEKENLLNVIAAALTAAVVILGATSAATAQQTPQYQVGGLAEIKNPKAPAATRAIDASKEMNIGWMVLFG